MDVEMAVPNYKNVPNSTTNDALYSSTQTSSSSSVALKAAPTVTEVNEVSPPFLDMLQKIQQQLQAMDLLQQSQSQLIQTLMNKQKHPVHSTLTPMNYWNCQQPL
jgi:hypothetical protein